MYNLLKFVPKNHMSRLLGLLVHWQGPTFFVQWMIQKFAATYKINLEECEKPISDYPSLGEFFIRKLKNGVRPIAKTWAVHPADSEITQSGPLGVQGKLIQAKGKNYLVSELLQDSEWHKKYQNGFFATYYLCPTDYHRVHSPVDGQVTQVTHIPGHLWPVNNWSVSNIENLFSINERIVVEIETELGVVAVVFVGATNVGQICLSFDEEFIGNSGQGFRRKEYPQAIPIQKGDELGMFRMGSTVVMIYGPAFFKKWEHHLELGPKVQMGQALTKF